MNRLVVSFHTLHQVLSAEKALRASFHCRVTPIPPGIGDSICGMAIEILNPLERDSVVNLLTKNNLAPVGIHEIS
jgi:hypothetical protein